MRSNHLVAAAFVSVVALIGCDKARPLPAPADPARGCTSCHGGQDNSTGAPPLSLPRNAAGVITAGGNRYDNTATTTHVEVGAHTRHIERGVSCGACHVVPAMITSPGHNTGQRAKVTFKELAAAGNVIPSTWNVDPAAPTHTCTNYCHGSSLNAGGTNHAPDWLRPSDGACGTCHGQAAGNPLPPASSGHPQVDAGNQPIAVTGCIDCHRDTVNADGTINVAGGKHVNGQIDGGGHPAGWADPINHGPAASGGLQNCAVCHGANFGGNGDPRKDCNACHALNGHPNWQTECTFCHGSATRAADATFPNAGSGTVVRANLASPPLGSQRENTITAYAVGAHEAHVSAGPFARAVQCSDCHGPTLPADIAHVNGTVHVEWSATASNGIVPTPAAGNLARWNDATLPVGGANCTNFCHGATLAGGTHTSPRWNEGPTGATCGSCHAIPLPYTAAGGWHVPRSDCGTCHPGYSTSPVAAVNAIDHIFVGAGPQGLTCHSCHGSATNDAPPNDTAGNTAGVKVGAHQKHVTGTTYMATAFTCGECHPSVTSIPHANGSVGIAWALAASTWPPAVFPAPTPAAGSLPASWETAPTCTNYCHGGFTNGKAATVAWYSTPTPPPSMTCNSCHGAGTGAVATLPGGTHPQSNPDCSACHTGYTTGTVNRAVHLNGQVDVIAMSCTACHGDATRVVVASAPNAALVQAAPPQDASAALSGNLVGAHQQHVNQGATAPAFSNALACANCHSGQIPATAPHADYSATPVAWGNLATTRGAAPTAYAPASKTCSNTYCHGQFTPYGKTGNTVSWGTGTLAKLACNACHGQSAAAPQPAYPHPQNTGCGSCHPSYTSTTVAAATHVDGLTTRSTAGCTACHGDRSDTAVTRTTNTVKAAPGLGAAATSADTTGATLATAAGVGAHVVHLGGTNFRAALACTDCHALPPSDTDTSHATGTGTGGARATLTWSTLASGTAFETKAPGYTRPTCSSVYCHNPKSADTAAANPAPSWIAPGTVTCGSCHGLPPVTAAHPANTACSGCHPGYPDSPTAGTVLSAAAKLLHINGQLDGGGESGGGLACTGCHGAIVSLMTTAASKHSLVGWTDTSTDSGGDWSAAATLGAIAPANRSCVNMCHSDHPHTLTTPATATHQYNLVADPSSAATRNAASSTSATRAATDFDPVANTGMCTRCHSKPIVTGGITVADASFGASAHDFTSSTTPAIAWSFALHDGSLFLRNCTKCHASPTEGTTPASSGTGLAAVHGQANPNLLAGTSRPAGVAAGFVCYNCHGTTASPANGAQGNRSNKNIQAQINKTRNHPAAADNSHDTATEFANAAFGNTLGVTGRHSSCMDCHDSHEARAGTHAVTTNLAGPPLQGSWGAKLTANPAFWTAPNATSFTKTVMVAGTDVEATLCFKCHSSYYGALPASPSGGYTETDTAREFNPANVGNYAGAWVTGETAGGFHPVLASSANNLGAINMANLVTTNFAWRTTGARNMMTCTDCHESETTTDPNGPHGSTAAFILKGPNTAWNNTLLATTTSMPAGTFCANCHSATWANSRFQGTTTDNHFGRSAHRVACWNCHARVPHGGPRPGMLVAPAGANANVGGTIAGWDATPPYSSPGSGSRLYIVSYPTNNTTEWQQRNCGCNGTGH